MKLVMLVAVLAASLVWTAGLCGPAASGRDAGTRDQSPESPAGTPVSPPVARTSPAPGATPAPVLRTEGRAVYLRGGELYVGGLDGSSERALTSGSARCGAGCLSGTGYAGRAEFDGETWLYWVQAVAQVEPSAFVQNTMRYEVFRAPEEGGATEELLRFDGVAYPGTVAVSPDGAHVVYAATDGLHRFDVTARRDVLLFANVTDCNRLNSPSCPCQIYEEPLWSPRGDQLYIDIGYAEGARPALLDPMAPPRAATQLNVGGRFAAWSPDGTRLCMSEDGYAQGGGGVVDVATGVFRRLTDDVPVNALSCGWSPDGVLAITSRRAESTAAIAYFTFRSIDDMGIETLDLASGVDGAVINAWLPNDEGVIVSWGVGEERPRTWVQLRHGGVRQLAIDAEEVFAVLP